MRGTLHLVAAEDLPLMLAIFAPLHLARGQRRLTELGLPPDLAERSTEETAAILADDGPLTRHELAARLRARGVPVDARGQAPIHVVRRAALAGVLCEAGVRGREELYGAIDPGPLPDRDSALVELASRYGAAHAPATREDFAAWSGLPAADVRGAWAEPDPPAGDPPAGPLQLLPAFDEWLLGWASRDLVVAPENARRVAPGGGIIRPVAIADGRVVATWRLDRRARRVELDAFGRVPRRGAGGRGRRAWRLPRPRAPCVSGRRTSTAAGWGRWRIRAGSSPLSCRRYRISRPIQDNDPNHRRAGGSLAPLPSRSSLERPRGRRSSPRGRRAARPPLHPRGRPPHRPSRHEPREPGPVDGDESVPPLDHRRRPPQRRRQ